ncbi:MAG TPA: MBL fold metallo-hydrolase [Stellaceae bacterium]|jgi:phosphoribosyl 1,2-cyclic phosphodiesterase|nr:MBL fold metallo-hydrolase [Stellaceae bacterium]
MAGNDEFSVRFWGVRGSVACPGSATVRYGGNTSCVEVRCGDALVIFDTGTGIRALGEALVARGDPVDADIFYSHCHIDHICGLPFFAPCARAGDRLRLWAGHLLPASGLAAALRQQFSYPLFPIEPSALGATLEFRDFRGGEILTPRPALRMSTGPLNHPGGATGYRLEFAGRAVAFITDTEHVPGRVDPEVLKLVAGVDLMIYDATYTDDELAAHAGWGHSTWQEALRIADAARAKRVALFHHAPEHDDAFLDEVAKAVAERSAESFVAREGLTVAL